MSIWLFFIHLLVFTNIYEYTVPAASGGTFRLNDYKGKKMLIVNIATGSRFSSQLTALETLYQRHKDSLVVIAIPSNTFGKEPLNDLEIGQQLTDKYNAHFLVAAKSIVSGATQLPLYKWLTSANENGVVDNPVTADFQKFLINNDGQLVGIFSANAEPLGAELENAIINN